MYSPATCPLCGHEVSGSKPFTLAARNEIIFGDKTVRVTPMVLELFSLLLEAYPEPVPKHELMAGLYEDRPDDKLPDTKIIDVFVWRLRKAFRASAMPIELLARHAHGARAGYALSF